MAKIWKVRTGNDPTTGGAWKILPFDHCVKIFNLRQTDFVKALPKEGEIPAGPRFRNSGDHLAGYGEPTIVVVQTFEDEPKGHGWKDGFYRAQVSIGEAERLINSAHG